MKMGSDVAPKLYGRDCTLDEIITILERYVSKVDIIGDYKEYFDASLGLDIYKKIRDRREVVKNGLD